MANITALPVYVDPSASYATGGGTFASGKTATLEAHAADGYYFTHWTDAAGKSYYENPLDVTVGSADETYTAHFASAEPPEDPEDEGEDPTGDRPEYTVTVQTEHGDDGIVTGGGVYEQGETCTITATENPLTPDYLFVGWRNSGWTNPGNKLLKKRIHSFEVFDDETWTAIFDSMGPSGYDDWTDDDEEDYEEEKKKQRQTINVTVTAVTAYDDDSSSVTGGGKFCAGETCTLTATADTSVHPNNHLICWKRFASNDQTSTCLETRTENPYSFTVYAPDQYWFAYFGSGLKRVKISTDGPDYSSLQGVDCNVVPNPTKYLSDVTKVRRGVVDRVIAFTTVTSERSYGIYIWSYFYIPQQDGNIGIWRPAYIIERNSGRKIEFSLADFWNDKKKYEGTSYYLYYEIYPEYLVPEESTVDDLFVHFIQVGFILRNSGDVILRNNVGRVLRGDG